jgi:hypothetical protein
MAGRAYNPIRRIRVKKTDDLKAIYAKVKRAFTAADLQQYTVNEEGVPADEVVADLKALAKSATRKRKQK